MRWLTLGCVLLFYLGQAVVGVANESSTPSRWEGLRRGVKENPVGAFFVRARPRYEFADDEGRDVSHALTLRLAPGFGTRRRFGLSALVEGELIAALDGDDYWDTTGATRDRTPIADPPDLDLNRAYLDWEHAESRTHFRLGRQRLAFDDARFVGNAPWRQNEQTFDAVFLRSGFGRKDVFASYTFTLQVNRIFGDRGPASRRDSETRNHFVRLGWRPDERFGVTAYAYLIDLRGLSVQSSHTFGGRLRGTLPIAPAQAVDYTLEVAHQVDAADNPVDYAARFMRARFAFQDEELGEVALAFDRLGSDDGRAVFATPLGSRHAVNGLADVFLDNGGPDGLLDASLSLAPRLPARFETLAEIHYFRSDEVSTELGWEVDAYLSRALTPSLSAMAKVAWFRGLSSRAPEDRLRVWLMFELSL